MQDGLDVIHVLFFALYVVMYMLYEIMRTSSLRQNTIDNVWQYILAPKVLVFWFLF